jgi:4-hydroxyphenylpyruvate dioxygenase
MISLEQKPSERAVHSNSPIIGIHHVELWVGNALQASHFFRTALGFALVGVAGPRTGCIDRVSYLMAQGSLYVILSSGLKSESPITEWVALHGDGVRDVALLVQSAEKTWRDAVARGARSIEDPHVERHDESECDRAVITAFGDTVHSLISGDDGNNKWFGAFARIECTEDTTSTVSALDHIAIAVEFGGMEKLAKFYMDVFAMSVTHQEDINTLHSGMRSQVLESDGWPVRFTIVEPVNGKRTSQVQEFVQHHSCAGVQHIALLTSDIFATTNAMKATGVEFLAPPQQYYNLISERLPGSPFDEQELRQVGVMLDKDEWGYLLQVFSKPIHNRPTLFVELIQREGARGFGRGNIRALFQAIELEMATRENL